MLAQTALDRVVRVGSEEHTQPTVWWDITPIEKAWQRLFQRKVHDKAKIDGEAKIDGYRLDSTSKCW